VSGPGAGDRAVEVHPTARVFGAVADRYDRGRPDYPPSAVAWLAGRLGLGPGRTVVDLAAGTGKLTAQLLVTGATVLAVEPSAGMRRVLAARCPSVPAFEGTAEAMPLESGSVDAVVVGQAFHWFDGPAALDEIHRVLRPGGSLGLIWNRRDPEQPWGAELAQLFERHRGGTPTHRDGAWRRAFETTALFGPLTQAAFSLTQPLDADGLVDRVLSVSYNAALEPAEQGRLADDTRRLVEAAGGTLGLRYVTDTFAAPARPLSPASVG
jgi:ubiquinone/menaquinone biosynthesis C-methylase UbiE